MNGATVYVGRARGVVNVGRASPSVAWSNNGGFPANANGSLFWPTNGWPRASGVCQPIAPKCCCAGPVNIAPGEVMPLTVSWAQWIDGTPGFAIDSVHSASLTDPTNSMEPADPDVIRVVSGLRDPRPGWEDEDDNGATGATGPTGGTGPNGNGEPEWNEEVRDLISLIPPYGTLVLLEAAPDARIGAQFKLDICLVAHDCDGRRIRQCQCVVIVVAEC